MKKRTIKSTDEIETATAESILKFLLIRGAVMDFEKISILRLKEGAQLSEHYYQKPLLILYSGGKDSEIILELAKKSGIKYEVQHSHTTADAPETVQHIRKRFQELELQGVKCSIDYPLYKGQRTSMWDLIPKKGTPPTRIVRYCCSVLKETSGKNRACVSGVRRAESVKRNGRGILENISTNSKSRIVLNNDNDDRRRIIERCQMQSKIMCNVIVDWDNDMVKDYISSYNLTLNPLYGCGFSRVGCIGCPMASKKGRQVEFARYPVYEKMYINAFERMLSVLKSRGNYSGDWQTGVDVYHWWMQDNVLPGQLSLFDQ